LEVAFDGVACLRGTGVTWRRATVPGGQPQLDRNTSSVGSTSTLGRSDGSAIRSIRRSQARSPMPRMAWCTVVSGGSHRLAGKMSSKPTTAMSCGTRMPCAVRVRSAPMAIWSFAQMTASGRTPVASASASSHSAASPPLCTVNRPVNEPVSTVPGCASMTDSMASLRAIASGALVGPSTWNSRRLPCSSIRCATRACAPDQLSADTTSAPRIAVSPATTTTGSRLASSAITDGATTPSPISRPSTFPDSLSMRVFTGSSCGSVVPLVSSSRRNVMSSDQLRSRMRASTPRITSS
jgi:hypothetical protein